MKKRSQVRLLSLFYSFGFPALLAACAFSFSARAEDAVKPDVKPVEKKTGEKPDEKKGTTDEIKPEAKPVDPTQPSAKLRQILRGPERSAEVVQRPVELAKAPEITFKGLIRAKDKPAAAMIEIKGRQAQVVREGSQISAIASDGTSVELMINKISSDGVEIDITKLKQTLMVK
jgi:hypothetical protein